MVIQYQLVSPALKGNNDHPKHCSFVFATYNTEDVPKMAKAL